jgi:hypothetical protein
VTALGVKPIGRTATLAMALALPIALAGTRFCVVPTADGAWRGLVDPPGALRVALAAVLGLTGARLLRDRGAPFLVLLLSAAPLVPVLTGRFLPLLAFQGPVLLVLALGATAVVVGRSRPSRMPKPARPEALFAIAFLFYVLLGTRIPGPAGPQGDEPHYLTMAESLKADGDLDLRNQFRERAYSTFFSGTLEAHTSPASPKGTLYAVHTPGLALLILPAYALGGYPGARMFLSALAALTAALGFALVRDVTHSEWTARASWAALAFLPPLAFYALAIYPETPAALAIALFLLSARRDPGPKATLAAGLAAGALPWLHPKFLPLAILGLGLTLARRGRVLPRVAAALVFAASLCGLLAWLQVTYGHASLAAAYGPGFESDVAPSRIPWGALALCFDRQFGLLATAPLWALAAPGLFALWRLRPGDAMRAALFAGATLALGASFSMWWGGTCPPARFVVPALPALALALGPALARWRTPAAALFGVSLAVVAVAALAPRALHNRADGASALFRVLTPALEADTLLPSFIVPALPQAPHLDPQRATLELLEAWDEGNLVGPPLSLGALAVPLDLPDAPWTLLPGELRFSRKLDLPPGTYRVLVRGRALQAGPRDRVARIDVATDDEVIADAYVQEGRPDPAFDLSLPNGARRLTLTAVGLQGKTLIEDVRLTPLGLVPRSRR